MPRENVMQHFLKGKNVGLMICRQQKTKGFYHCLVHENIVESSFVSNKTSEIGYVFPLYLYPDKLYNDEKRKPNLNETIINKISELTGLQFIEEKEEAENTFAPIDVLDYIYAVLHNSEYREKYREFLKIDFPRVPFPQNAEQFFAQAEIGAKLRRLHLMEGVEPQSGIADFPIKGNNEIESLKYLGEKVYINKIQYFDHVPSEAWNFYIGGYQPAQKWLKDRKGRILSYDDIRHYQRIIRILKETDEIMREFNN
jgi:predicted helicase